MITGGVNQEEAVSIDESPLLFSLGRRWSAGPDEGIRFTDTACYVPFAIDNVNGRSSSIPAPVRFAAFLLPEESGLNAIAIDRFEFAA